MNPRDKIAFSIYLVVALAWIAFGIVYISCPNFMPYHRQAVNMPWEALDPGLQVLIRAFMKMAAAGFFVSSLAVLVLLFIPFRRQAPWAHRAIPLLGIVWNGLSLYVTSAVALETGASTPWRVAAAGTVLMIAGFILSPGSGRKPVFRAHD